MNSQKRMAVTRKRRIWHLAAYLLSLLALSGLSCINRPKIKVRARYWTGTSNSVVSFPEQEPTNHVWKDLKDKSNLGLCFSGGGTRSASATVGQLRALHELGVLQKARYTAAASGGSWALVPYTYIDDRSLSNFLERYVPPGEFTNELVFKPGDDSLTEAVSEAAVTLKGLGYLLTLRGAEEYARTISDRFLKPFGLGDPEKWFTWNEQTAMDVLQRNPDLKSRGFGDYYVAAPSRPFPIIGGTIRHYDIFRAAVTNMQIKRVPVEYTPLYSGVRQWQPPNRYTRAPIGGGYVESFAYDSIRPVKAESGVAETWLYRRIPWITSPVLNLGDVIGSSGAAPGELSFMVHTFGFPRFNHWSPQSLDERGSVNDWRYAQEDGGLSENLAIMPLLARRVDRIVAFVNAQERVSVQMKACKSAESYTNAFPDYIEALFGRVTEGIYAHTQVFEPCELNRIADEVQNCLANTNPAVVTTKLQVKANERFGVSPYEVKVLWVFLEAKNEKTGKSVSGIWRDQIPLGPVRNRFKSGGLKNFPNYRTFAESRGLRIWPIIQLSEEQTTMLAHYTAWVVKESKDKIETFLK